MVSTTSKLRVVIVGVKPARLPYPLSPFMSGKAAFCSFGELPIGKLIIAQSGLSKTIR
jgi:hypothetical protein